MQRSCSALAVLLTLMASSVLVVDRVQSQSPGLGATCLPGPASVCGFIAGNPRIVLGQSVGDEYDSFWGDSCYADYVASDDAAVREKASSLATEEAVRQNQWWNTLGTGYDAAYDFAMHEGQYLDESTTDEDAEFLVAHEENDLEYGCQLGSRWQCDDFHCIRDDHSETSGVRVCPWAGRDLTLDADSFEHADYELTSDVASNPQLWNPETSAWLIENFRCGSAWLKATIHAASSTHNIDLWRSRCESIAMELWMSEHEALEVPTSTPQHTVIVDHYEEEVLALTTADTLDQIAAGLEETAQYIRNWAANRIVAKHHARRVARKPSH